MANELTEEQLAAQLTFRRPIMDGETQCTCGMSWKQSVDVATNTIVRAPHKPNCVLIVRRICTCPGGPNPAKHETNCPYLSGGSFPPAAIVREPGDPRPREDVPYMTRIAEALERIATALEKKPDALDAILGR